MELNYQDNELFKNYILSFLKNNKSSQIELLLDNQKCNDITIIQNDIDLTEYLNNITILLEYLKNNNLLIKTWLIRSKYDLFKENNWFKIMDLFYNYFNYFQQSGQIYYHSNYYFCDNKNITNQINEYINKFNKINVRIFLPYNDYLHTISLTENKIHFLQTNNERIFIIINPEEINHSIQNYQNIIKYFDDKNDLPFLILNKNINWQEKEIEEYLKLLEYIIYDYFSKYNYNIKDFSNFVLFPKNIASRTDMIVLEYFDKYKNNTLQCHLNASLTINCKDLSFPSCCGLCYSFFNGGKFLIKDQKIYDIVANEGINGFFNQKMANSFYLPKCYGCINKYFCLKQCRSVSFEYQAEPFLPVKNICLLLDKKINLLINKYHELGLFHEFFKNRKIDDDIKYQIITLLKNKGYPEYEYRYC